MIETEGDQPQSLEDNVKNIKKEIVEKIVDCGPAELVLLNKTIQDIPSLEELEKVREKFIESFETKQYLPEIKYFYKEILDEFNSFGVTTLSTLVDDYITYLSICRKELTRRMTDENTLKKFVLDYVNEVEDVSRRQHMFECIKLKILSEDKMELTEEEYNILAQAKQFLFKIDLPIIVINERISQIHITRRSEVIQRFIRRLKKSLENPKCFKYPYFNNKEDFEKNLKRISDIFHIECDISEHDGQHFLYTVDKLFTEIFRKPFIIPGVEEPPELNKDAHVDEIINFLNLNSITPNSFLVSKFNLLMSSSIDEVWLELQDGSYQASKRVGVPQEMILCERKLMFVRNRLLLSDVINKIKQIYHIYLKIAKTEGETTENNVPGFTMFRKQFLATLTQYLTKDDKDVNYDILFEESLILEGKYQDSKIKVLEGLYAVTDAVPPFPGFTEEMWRMVNMRPDLNSTDLTSFIEAYEVMTDVFLMISKTHDLILPLQMYHERRSLSEFNYYTNNNEFYTYYSLRQYYEYIRVSVMSVNHTFKSIFSNYIRYKSYMKYAIYEEIWQVCVDFLHDPLCPLELFQPNIFKNMDPDTIDFLNYDTTNLKGKDLFDFTCHYQTMIYELYKAQELLPVYKKQVIGRGNIPEDYFDWLIIEKFSFDNMNETCRRQFYYNLVIRLGIQYNNYSIDYTLFKDLLNLPENFEIKSKVTPSLENLAHVVLVSVPEKCNAIIDVTTINYDDKEHFIEFIKNLSLKIELAYLSQQYDVFFAYNVTRECLPKDSTSVIDENGRFNTTTIPYIENLLLSDDKIDLESVVHCFALRLRFLYFSRIEQNLNLRMEKILNSCFTRTIPCTSMILLKQIDEESQRRRVTEPHEFVKFYEEVQEVFIGRFIYSLMKCILEKTIEQSNFRDRVVGRRTTKGGSVDIPLKQLYLSIVESCSSDDKRYIPLWLTQLMHQLEDQQRMILIEALKSTDNEIADSLATSKVPKHRESSIRFLRASIELVLYKLCYYQLYSKSDFETLNLKTLFTTYTKKIGEVGRSSLENEIKIHKQISNTGNYVDRLSETIHIMYFIKNLLDNMLKKQQKQKIANIYVDMNKKMNFQYRSSNPMIKPEIYQKKKSIDKKSVLYFPEPGEISTQFEHEYNYSSCKIVFAAYDAVRNSKSDDYTINVDLLKSRLCYTSSLLSQTIKCGQGQLYKIWKSYSQNLIRIIELNENFEAFHKIYIKLQCESFHTMLQIFLVEELSDRLFELCTLIDEFRFKKKEMKRFEKEITKSVTDYFEGIIDDIHSSMNDNKQNFHYTEDHIVQTALDQLNNLLNDHSYDKEIVRNHQFLPKPADPIAYVKNDIEKLKKDIIKIRVIRALNNVGPRKHYTKLTDFVAYDRRCINGVLWSGRRDFEEVVYELDKGVIDVKRTLKNYELDSEELKLSLTDVVKKNSKQVHIKNLLKLRKNEIEQDIDSLKSSEEYDVGELILKLEEKTEELEALREEHEKFDEEYTKQVREPMENLYTARKNVKRSHYKLMSTAVDKIKCENEVYYENYQLKLQNQELKQQIQYIESQLANTGSQSSRVQKKKIVKPLFNTPQQPKLARASLKS